MQEQQFFDPSTPTGFDDGKVLKSKIFKPLRNSKTGNFFSYSYDVIERNRSANSDGNIEWVTGAPQDMQAQIESIRVIHDKIYRMKIQMKGLAKKGTQYQMEEMQERVNRELAKIDEIIYPENEREYVESSESKRVRLDNQKELTLDAGTIAALQGQPAPGSTSDASVAEAKLKLAEETMAKMQTAIDDNAQGNDSEKDDEIAMLRNELAKPPSRRKAEFKPK